MLSISDEHKEAIIRLINSIISEFPLITNLTNRSKVNNKLVKMIHWFQQSVDHNTGNRNVLELSRSSDALIENWLLHYYFGDEVMDSFAIEDGLEQELSTASLLILYVIYKLSNCFPHIKMYFDENWVHLQEFDSRLDQMLRSDKLMQLLSNQSIGNTSSCINQNQDTNQSLNIEQNTNLFQTRFKCLVQATDSATDHLNCVSFCNSKPRTYQNNDVLCLNSNDELIVPQLLNSDVSTAPQSLLAESQTQRFVCNECERSFVTKYKLTRHQFVHKPATKPLKCTWVGCERRFRARYDRNRHFLTHTGERPFVCDWPQCDKRFSRADKLKAHKLKHYNQ